MAGTLHAELTADSQHIVILAVGDAMEQRRMGEVLALITPALRTSKTVLKIEGGVVLPVTWPTVVQLDHTFRGDDGYGGGNGWIVYGPRLKEWILAELAARQDRDDPLPVKLPEGCVPRDYQIAGARSIGYIGRFLLLDDPGVGKTVSAILGLAWRQERGENIFPCVVVVPGWGVGRAWEREMAKWMPHWRTALWTGALRTDTTGMPLGALYGKVPTRVRNLLVNAGYKNVTAVRRALKKGELDSLPRLGKNGRDALETALADLAAGREPAQPDIYIVTYATARRDALADGKGPLLKIKPRAVVADEVHWIANPDAKQTKAVQRIAGKARTFVGLSGTVIRTDVRDLWPTLKAMESASWPAGKRCTDRYCIKGNPDYGTEIEGLDPAREPEFRDTLMGAMRRVSKADVLTQLPPKIYSVRRIAMPDEWREPYDQMQEDMLAELPDGQELPAFDVLTRMNHLSQMASSAFDVKMTEGPEVDKNTGELKKHYHVILREPCWKADELMEIMAERRGCAPIVCFAPSRQLVMLAGLRASKDGYRVGYYTGLGRDPDHPAWPTISEKSRQSDFDAFQAGKLDLLCVTTQSGGTGLTLTAGGTEVFLRRPWELTDAIQAEDRCLTTGTPVLTENGWVPVEDVHVGDTVVTHTGESQPVTDIWSRLAPHSRIMAEIGITGQEPITCTADHPFLLKSGQWRDAGDLKPGNWLAVPGNDIADELTQLAFGDARIAGTFLNAWGTEQVNGRLIHAPETIQVTDDFLYTLGYYAGDGFASTGSDKGRFISFSGNQDTKTVAMDRCEQWATSVGLQGARNCQPAPARGAEQRFYSAEWAYWFSGAFGHGARNKHLPAFVLGLNERQSRIVLDGLSASDGYRRDGRPRCEYSTMSGTLAANVLQLATRAGYRPSLTRGSTGQHIVAFGGTPSGRSAGRVRSVLLRYPDRREVLYDITVKDAETFVVGGVVVHNCHRIGSEDHETFDGQRGVEIIDVRTIASVETRVVARLKQKGANLAELVRDPRIAREMLGGNGDDDE